MKRLSRRTIFALVLLAVAVFFLAKQPSGKGKRPDYIRYEGFVFGTTYHITYASPEMDTLSENIDRALAAVDRSLSMFNRESLLYRINANDTSVRADELFMRVWQRGVEVSHTTGGAFDMTVAPLVNLWGFGIEERSDVTEHEVNSVRRYVGYEMITVSDGRVEKRYPEMKIDASAIAKGFACDVVADTLRAHGCTSYCVEIGGEVAVNGVNPEGGAWRIGINKPVEDSLCMSNELQDIVLMTHGGMATSGNYRNFYEDGGKKFSHTINPATGYPERKSILSATIIADDCMTADAYATACMVMGADSAKALCERYSDLKGYIIYDDNGTTRIWKSPDFPECVKAE